MIIYPNSKTFALGNKIDITFPLLLNPIEEMAEVFTKIVA